MDFHIEHHLDYRYERPVFLEPFQLRLRPRSDPAQRLLNFNLAVSPDPSGQCLMLDANGNEAIGIWFQELTDHLSLRMEAQVETLRPNPFDWIITHLPTGQLPASYPPEEAESLAPCLAPGADDLREVGPWAAELAAAVGQDTPAFLMHLADTIHQQFDHVGRLDGDPFEPAACLKGRRGACRDTAMLYVAACRSLGLAARFVSGYSMHHPPEVTEHELHAWAEVYLPGAGWRGYDPSLGLAVADGHVVLAAAPDHRLAAAVQGRYRGTGVGSQLNYRVVVQTSARDALL
ncbi:MAG: transglutaminase family protein [Cyanobacteria bacterium]|nr:transglutaminase family protein [Cyanobacteriota bacterium]